MTFLRDMRYSIIAAAVAGTIFGLLVPATAMWPVYDRLFPVVEMRGQLVRFDADAAVVHITGRKLRDCKYIRIQAYTEAAEGRLRDIYIRRVDIPETGGTKATGNYDIGYWAVRPVDVAHDDVRVFVQHECSGRTVLTKIAEIHW